MQNFVALCIAKYLNRNCLKHALPLMHHDRRGPTLLP